MVFDMLTVVTVTLIVCGVLLIDAWRQSKDDDDDDPPRFV